MSEQTPPTPAGWYPDPQHPGQQRYWDGSAWAPPVAPPPAAPAPAAGTMPPAPPAPGMVAGAPMAAPPTSSNAIVGLVLAIVSWFICPIIAAIVALFVARSSSKEIAASGGRIGGAGLNTATRIIAWINIGVYAVAGIIMAVLAILGIGFFAQVASEVNPAVNTQTGLPDGEYVMDPTSFLLINERCTFSGPVSTLDQTVVASTTIYGEGFDQCGLSLTTEADLVFFEVVGGTARIIETR